MSPRARSAGVVLLLLAAAAALALLLGPDGAPPEDPTPSPARVGPRPTRPPRRAWATPPPPTAGAARTPTGPPASSSGAAGPGSSAPPDAGSTDRGPARAGETVSLRGVRGRVVDARTRAPLAGAWVTWRPVPPDRVDELFRSRGAATPGGGEHGLITDGEGLFDVARLPDDEVPRWTLHAVAPGHAPGWLVPGLQDEVELALEPAGGLEVVVRGRLHDGARLDAVGPGGVGWSAPSASLEPGSSWRLARLAAGRWEVALDGRLVGQAEVVPGAVARVEVEAPPLVPVRGQLRGLRPGQLLTVLGLYSPGRPPPAPPGGEPDVDPWPGPADLPGRTVVLQLDREGAFTGEAPPGRYRALLVDSSERWLGEVEVREGAAPLELTVPGEPLEVHLTCAGGWPGQDLAGRSLGLVRMDVEPPSFLELALDEGADWQRSVARGRAETGRYLVFLDSWCLGAVTAGAGPASLDVRAPVDITLRWTLPPGLRRGEALRARAALVPDGLEGSAARRFARLAAWSFSLPADDPRQPLVVLPGRHRLVGWSDLGPFDLPVVVAGPGEVEVRLP